jgi:hypothetical protein
MKMSGNGHYCFINLHMIRIVQTQEVISNHSNCLCYRELTFRLSRTGSWTTFAEEVARDSLDLGDGILNLAVAFFDEEPTSKVSDFVEMFAHPC